MPLRIKVKVGKVGNSLRITIPKEVAEQLGIEKGDILLVGLTDSKILIEKA